MTTTAPNKKCRKRKKADPSRFQKVDEIVKYFT